MIPIEKQVTSLELSQRLEKLGVKQDSLFMWTLNGPDKNGEYWNSVVRNGKQNRKANICDWVAAYTVSELGEILGMRYWGIEKHSNEFRAGLLEPGKLGGISSGDTMANAMAKMLIYLIENGLITLK